MHTWLSTPGPCACCRYLLGNQGKAGSEDQATATTAVTEALAAIHVVQAYNLQVRSLLHSTHWVADTPLQWRSLMATNGCSLRKQLAHVLPNPARLLRASLYTLHSCTSL